MIPVSIYPLFIDGLVLYHKIDRILVPLRRNYDSYSVLEISKLLAYFVYNYAHPLAADHLTTVLMSFRPVNNNSTSKNKINSLGQCIAEIFIL